MKKIIITDINFLKKVSEPVKEGEDISNIIKDLEDSLDLKRGLGLSACQIGILKQVGIIRRGDFKLDLINPILIEKNGRFRYQGEGCLSIPYLSIDTARYADITVDINGKTYSFDIETDGIIAIAIQHEIDHFQGRTILNRKWQKRK